MTGEEFFFYLDEIAKGYPPPETAGSNDQVGKTTCRRGGRGILGGSIGNVVDEVLVVGVRQFLRGRMVYLREDERGE